MTHLHIFIAIVFCSSIIAYFNGKRVSKEGYSFGKTFFFTLIGCVGLGFFLAKLLTN